MKKIILLALVAISVFSIVSAIQNCELALPRYGILECRDVGEESTVFSLSAGGDSSTGSYTCPTSCVLSNLPVLSCSWGTSGHWEVSKNWQLLYEKSSTGSTTGNLPINFGRGDILSVKGYCRNALFQKTPLSADVSQISITQRKYMLQEGWAGSLPTITVSNTEGCTLNKVVDKYKGESEINSYLNPNNGQTESKPSSTYSSTSQMPANWNLNDNYVFVKDWQTGIADISLTYDKNNKGYWCGGVSGSRKIYNVNEINSNSGKCYALPTSVYLSNVECCFPADCSWKGAKYTCNPETWKCEETRPCNSQLDCEQTFGAGVCNSKQVTKWVCDNSKKWGSYAGTCVSQVNNVEQCPSDCTTKEYYNDERGKCLPRSVVLDCPADKCCSGDGNYKALSCSGGLSCCYYGSDSIIGECRKNCDDSTVYNSNNNALTGNAVASVESGSKGGLIFLIVMLVILAIVVGTYFYFKKKGLIRNAPVESGVNCCSCGTVNKTGTKFCISCGKKIGGKSKSLACKHCGKSNEKWRKFCIHCGKSLLE